MTNELAIKILSYMVDHEENNLIIFGNKKDNANALRGGINAIKFIQHIEDHFKKEHPDWDVKCKICNKTIGDICNE